MKLVFELDLDDSKLPDQFKGGIENILSFLHKQLFCLPNEKALTESVNMPYLKAFYDKQGGNGQAWVDAIKEHNEADVALGKLLLDSLKVEGKQEFNSWDGPRYILWVGTKQYYLCSKLEDAVAWKDKVGGKIYEPLGSSREDTR